MRTGSKWLTKVGQTWFFAGKESVPAEGEMTL